MAMGEANEQEEPVRQEEEAEDKEEAEDEEEADRPVLPSSALGEEIEEEEEEGEGRQAQRAQADEADSLLDSLQGGSYWTVAEGGRARRRTARLQESRRGPGLLGAQPGQGDERGKAGAAAPHSGEQPKAR